MIVWSGTCDANPQPTCPITNSYGGGRYDPLTDSWTPTTLAGVPEGREWHSTVWTGEAMIVWGGIGERSGYRHTGGSYYPDVADPNNAPIAQPDVYTTTVNVTLTVEAPGVLGNDSDPDGDVLTAVLVTPSLSGTLTLNGDGSFSYAPDPGFSGVDQLDYAAHDGLVDGNVVTVTINVRPQLIFMPMIARP